MLSTTPTALLSRFFPLAWVTQKGSGRAQELKRKEMGWDRGRTRQGGTERRRPAGSEWAGDGRGGQGRGRRDGETVAKSTRGKKGTEKEGTEEQWVDGRREKEGEGERRREGEGRAEEGGGGEEGEEGGKGAEGEEGGERRVRAEPGVCVDCTAVEAKFRESDRGLRVCAEAGRRQREGLLPVCIGLCFCYALSGMVLAAVW
eukprot:1142377-Rhodomonas_salina.2